MAAHGRAPKAMATRQATMMGRMAVPPVSRDGPTTPCAKGYPRSPRSGSYFSAGLTLAGPAPRLRGSMPLAEFPILKSEIAVSDPLAALRALAGLPHPFLLHSALDDVRGRWSF